ncbi:AAA family ATPase [Micromonospora sp. 067-2]|uniref:AAA family ATPase n=1 Tax=Micromonospora sp. 067-2 TaxID=2789270 RepID=UPI003978E7D3
MQPLLLLKQTVDASYDPGPLQLDGVNVSVTKIEQVLSRTATRAAQAKSFSVGVSINGRETMLTFGKDTRGDLRVLKMAGYFMAEQQESVVLREGMSETQIRRAVGGARLDEVYSFLKSRPEAYKIVVDRERCFLTLGLRHGLSGAVNSTVFRFAADPAENEISRIIHLPALRGNPRRTYRTTAVEERYPGTFDTYTAGIIAAWQNARRTDELAQLRVDLEELGLTWKVEARQLDDTQVELLVGRMPHAQRGGARDLVNIADVGFGVSQTLPVILALLAARPGQMVYLEQPEIHLHPRAQARFANLVTRALRRGVRVVLETHSSLFVRAIQTAIARGQIEPDDVALHWFTRDIVTGDTLVSTAELLSDGSFGEWPEDFDDVLLETESAYLDAAARTNEFVA